jgi:predicted nucleic acid-binding protein
VNSGNLKRIAVDSNAVLSAVIGKAALQVFVHSDLELITTDFNLGEVEEYLPSLGVKYALDERLLIWQFKMLPVKGYPKAYYESHWHSAEKFLKWRDPEDVHLAALALKENLPIWSNDRDFEGFPAPVYTTARLLKILGKSKGI